MALLEDELGYPWTASAGMGWVVLVGVGSCGIAFFLLGLYLSLWIWSKGRSLLPLVLFSLLAAMELMYVSLEHWHLARTLVFFEYLFAPLFIAATFSLRHEIVRHYREREGWDIQIGPWFTLFFSVVYINYCLNPVTLSGFDGAPTSLNLSENDNLRK